MKAISEKQMHVLYWILQWQKEGATGPLRRYLADHCLYHEQSVYCMLRSLERKGCILWERKTGVLKDRGRKIYVHPVTTVDVNAYYGVNDVPTDKRS